MSYARDHLVPLVDEGLGNSAYLADLGAGSFCSAPPGAAWVTTIGAEKASNPLLAAPDEDTFPARSTPSSATWPPVRRTGLMGRW